MRKPPQRNAREFAESLANLAHSTYQTGTAQTVTSRMQSVVLSSNRRTYRGVTCGPQLRCGAQTLSALCDHVAVHLESQKMEQTRLHVPAGRLSLHTPGAHSTRATPCAWPMSRLAPCDRGALDAPGSESTQCLIARVAHMYLTSQLPPQVIKKCPHNNVLLPTSYRPFRFQENHHQSFPPFFASAIQLSLYNLTDTLLLALQQQQKTTLP